MVLDAYGDLGERIGTAGQHRQSVAAARTRYRALEAC